MEFSYCLPGKVCVESPSIIGSTYEFTRCNFTDNEAKDSNSDDSIYIVPHHFDHTAFGRGGGLSIFVNGNSSGNVFQIDSCNFERNRALWGGGLVLEFHDATDSNTAYIIDTNFTENECIYTKDLGTAGGGMRIGQYSHDIKVGMGNHVTITGGSYVAPNGGGVSISTSLQRVSGDQLDAINIVDVVFTHNVAQLGSAIHIEKFPLIFTGMQVGVRMYLHQQQNTLPYKTGGGEL